MRKLSLKAKDTRDRHHGVVALYKSAKYTTEYIAKLYGITPRQVQRIAKLNGVIRTQAEANKVIAPLKHYYHVPKELRVVRKQISQKLRYKMVSEHPYCSVCGLTPDDGIRLEVDHIDENPKNNELSNLQVLCNQCNMGKSHLARFK